MLLNFKKASAEIKQAFAPPVTVAQIHEDFETYADKLISEIIDYDPKMKDKHDKLLKAGFSSASTVKKFAEIDKSIKERDSLNAWIDHYKEYYPNNKFITQDIVNRLCEKYSLVFGPVARYKGDIPFKNIEQITDFKVRNEDLLSHRNTWYVYEYGRGYANSSKGVPGAMWGSVTYGGAHWGGSYEFHTSEESEQYFYENKGFSICAPEKDFDMQGMAKRGNQLVAAPDPIVMQPVNGGYLIVSKWGDEANDQELVIESHN